MLHAIAWAPPRCINSISTYATHRHPDFWKCPEEFDPERFTPERAKRRPKFAYYPFGGGPRVCIGSNFALMEMQLILATLAQRYRLARVPGHLVEVQLMITMRPRYGMAGVDFMIVTLPEST